MPKGFSLFTKHAPPDMSEKPDTTAELKEMGALVIQIIKALPKALMGIGMVLTLVYLLVMCAG